MEAKFELTANDAQLKAAFDAAIQKIEKLEARTKKADDGFSRFRDNLTGGIASAVTLGGAMSVVLDSFQKFADQEQTIVAIKTIVGSASEAANLVGKIKALGAQTPFEFPELAKSAKMLLAFGESAADVTETLRRIGDISSGIGAPLTDVAEIYGKIRVQGRLFAEDINQLQGRGIPIVAELAKQYGTTNEAIKQMVTDGEIGFSDIEKAFVSLTSSGGKFFGMMDAQSQTMAGRISTLNDTVSELQVSFVKNFSDDVTGGIRNITSAVEYLGAALEKYKATMAYWGALANGATTEEASQAFMGVEFRNLKPAEKREDFKVGESVWQKEEKQWADLQKKMLEGAEELKTKRTKLNDELHDGQVYQFREFYKEQAKKYEAIAEQQIKDVEAANEIKIEAAESAYEIAKQEAAQADTAYKAIQSMRFEMGLFSEFAGRADLQATARGAKEIAEQLGIGAKEAKNIQGMMDALAAWDKKQAQDPRNVRNAEREERRREREGKAISEEMERRKKAAASDDDAARKVRGINRKAEKAVDDLEKANREAAERKQQKEMDERRAKEDVEAARKKAEEDLEAVKKNTKDTADKLKELSKA